MFRKAVLAAVALLTLTAERAGSLADSFGWLLGDWSYELWYATGPRRLIFRWTAPSPNRFEGVRGGQRFGLRFGPGGSIIYTSPGAEGERRYRAVRSGPGELVFEDRYGPWPQRVSFRREGEVLIHTISELDGSRAIATTLTKRSAAAAD